MAEEIEMSAAAREVEALANDEVFSATPLARTVVRACRRILVEPVHPAHEADRDTKVIDFVRAQRSKLQAELGNALGGDLQRLEYKLPALRQAPPEPDVARVVWDGVARVGGRSMLCDAAAAAAKSAAAAGLEIGIVTRGGVEIDGRVRSWTELIEAARPVSWSREDTWRGQFGTLPDEVARPLLPREES